MVSLAGAAPKRAFAPGNAESFKPQNLPFGFQCSYSSTSEIQPNPVELEILRPVIKTLLQLRIVKVSRGLGWGGRGLFGGLVESNLSNLPLGFTTRGELSRAPAFSFRSMTCAFLSTVGPGSSGADYDP